MNSTEQLERGSKMAGLTAVLGEIWADADQEKASCAQEKKAAEALAASKKAEAQEQEQQKKESLQASLLAIVDKLASGTNSIEKNSQPRPHRSP